MKNKLKQTMTALCAALILIDTVDFVVCHKKILLSFRGCLPVHQPIAFDTLIVEVIAFNLAGVAGIALNYQCIKGYGMMNW